MILRQRVVILLILACAVGGSAREASAQLDSSCMVSALNRTAPVQADGVWVLPNVPANLGQVRVRATCVQNGVVRFGASSLVTVPADGVVKVEEIQFQGPPPVPSSLALAASQVSLTVIGQTVQVLALASYPDSSTADVTAAEKGTDYRSSNPAIASVDANGLVTAHASGVALVSAVNEGALGVLRLQVVTSGDSDGDGLPDDWEVAHGLDPNNPADALDDPDHDGLTNLEEYQHGTDPLNPDTDGDGLSDGREVHELGTNPLRADTDGDGLRDGLEVQTGSDPLDPNSFNLAAALQSIEVAPGSFQITFNTVLGEASRQLRVTGRLIDGSSLEITAKRYGTTYGSSNLQVANFGPEDGRVYAGQDGAATIDVGNHGFAATAQVTVGTFSPQALSYVPLQGFPNNVALSGDYAFVATGITGLQVVNVADPANPFLAAGVDTPGNANDVRIVGGFAFVADGWNGLVTVDISQPAAPRIVGRQSAAGPANDLVVTGGRAYVAGEEGLAVMDVSDPSHPALLGSVATAQRARGVDVADGLAVVAAEGAGVYVIDVHDPAHPRILGSTATRPDGTSNAADVVVRGRLAYVADGAEPTSGGLRVIDFRDPANPVVVGSSTDAGLALTSTALEGGLALSSDYFLVDRVAIFETSPTAPQFRSILDFSRFAGTPSFRADVGHGLAVRDGYVYMVGTGKSLGLQDSGSAGEGDLFIGRYAVLSDDSGVPPAIAITAPMAGSRTSERTRVLLHAEAKDDVRVANVRFVVNGQTVFTAYDAPYEYSLTAPVGVSELRVGAVAMDDGGNEGSAVEVVLPVDPNSAPAAALLSPAPGQMVTAGTSVPIAVEASDDHGISKVEIYVDGALRKAVTSPPYRFDYAVPVGATHFSVSAIAYDNVGPSPTAGPLEVTVEPDGPPTAALIAPQDGSTVVAGSGISIVAGVSDDVGVRVVRVLVNGVQEALLFRGPFTDLVTAPPAGQTTRIQILAEDTRGQVTASPEITVTSVADPLTGIRGRTVDASGASVAGARVEAGGQATTSGADGSFEILGLPTVAGDFSLTASVGSGGFELKGSVDSVPPLPGGVVAVGDVVMVRSVPDTTVVGQIVDPAGAPLGGATVKVYNRISIFVTTAGADGRFSVAGVPASETLTVSATATVTGEKLRKTIVVSPVAGGVTDAGTFPLEVLDDTPDPGTTVTGRVLNSLTGAPVAGATVNVFTGFDVFPTVSAADGSFSLPGLPTFDGQLWAFGAATIDGVGFVGPAGPDDPEPEGVTDLGSLLLAPGSGGGGPPQKSRPRSPGHEKRGGSLKKSTSRQGGNFSWEGSSDLPGAQLCCLAMPAMAPFWK
jgi:hypothetical protein